jgi:L-amino acid N-acyltransferase YncA
MRFEYGVRSTQTSEVWGARMDRMEPGQAMRIRLATAADAEGILAIYAPIVRETAISFELEPPSVEEIQRRIEETLRDLPWLVSESENRIAGYAYASHHHERAAYQWSVDVSVYVAAEERGNGVGRSLYSSLLGIVQDLGYYTAFAGIALPNAASVALHESMGFRLVGVYRKAGYKLGAWHDVAWSGRPLREYDVNPKPPRSMAELDEMTLRRRLSGEAPAE